MADVKGLREYLDGAKKAVYDGVDAVVEVNREQAQALFQTSQALVPVETGTLRNSGQVKKTKTGATVVYTAPYAAKVEFSDKIQRKNGQRFFLHQPMTEQIEATGNKWQAAFLRALEANAKGG